MANSKAKPSKKSVVKNIGKSVAYSSFNVLENLMPSVGGSIRNSNEVIKEGRELAQKARIAMRDQERRYEMVPQLKQVRKLFDEAMDDLKTGNISLEKEMDGMDEEFDDSFTSFGDEEGFDNSDTSIPPSGNDYSSRASIEATHDVGRAIIAGDKAKMRNDMAIGQMVANSSIKASQTNAAQISSTLLYTSNMTNQSLMRINQNLESINSNLVELVRFQSENQAVANRVMMDFMDKTLERLDKMEQQKLMPHNRRNNNWMMSDDRNFSTDSGFDIKKYAKYVKQNTANTQIGSMLGMGASMGKMGLEMGMFRIPQMLLEAGITALIPRDMKKGMGNLDKLYKHGMDHLLYRLGDYAMDYTKSQGLRTIASILGKKRDDLRTRPVYGNYYKDEMGWNGVAQKALVDVIPERLANIEAALTGKAKTYFDYEADKFITEKELKKTYNAQLESSYRYGASGLVRELERALGSSGLSSAETKRVQETVSKLLNDRVSGKSRNTSEFRTELNSALTGAVSADQLSKVVMEFENATLEISKSIDSLNREITANGINRNSVYANLERGAGSRYFDTVRKKSPKLFGENVDSRKLNMILEELGYTGEINDRILRTFRSYNKQRATSEDDRLLKNALDTVTQDSNTSSKIEEWVRGAVNKVGLGNNKFIQNLLDTTHRKMNMEEDEWDHTAVDDVTNAMVRALYGKEYKTVAGKTKKGTTSKEVVGAASSAATRRAARPADTPNIKMVKKGLTQMQSLSPNQILNMTESEQTKELLKTNSIVGEEIENGPTDSNTSINETLIAVGNTMQVANLQNAAINRSIASSIFGKDGIFKKFFSSDAMKKRLDEIKKKLFDDDDAPLHGMKLFFSDKVNSVKRRFTGKGYTDSKGNVIADMEDDDESVFGRLKGIYRKGYDYTMQHIDGDDYKDKELYKNFLHKLDIDKKKVTSENAPEIISDAVAEASAEVGTAIVEKGEAMAETMFGNAEEAKNGNDIADVQKKISDVFKKKVSSNKKFSKIVTGGILGVGASLLAGDSIGLFGRLAFDGGPIAGAIVGSGLAMLTGTETFKRFMFGEEKDGERVGGLISKDNREKFKKALPWVVGSAVLGGLKKLILPGIGLGGGSTAFGTVTSALFGSGPIGGAVVGLGMAMLSHNKTFRNILFGKKTKEGEEEEQVGSKISENWGKFKDIMAPSMKYVKGGAKGALNGAITGTVLSSMGLLGGAFSLGGPIGFGLAGLGIGIASANEKFHKMVFGEKDEYEEDTIMGPDGKPQIVYKKTGNKSVGLIGRMRNAMLINMIDPIKDAFHTEAVKTAWWVKEKVEIPLRLIFSPMVKAGKELYETGKEKVKEVFDKIGEGAMSLMHHASKTIFGKVFSTIGDMGKTAMHATGTALRITGNFAAAPLMGIANFMGNRRQDKKAAKKSAVAKGFASINEDIANGEYGRIRGGISKLGILFGGDWQNHLDMDTPEGTRWAERIRQKDYKKQRKVDVKQAKEWESLNKVRRSLGKKFDYNYILDDDLDYARKEIMKNGGKKLAKSTGLDVESLLQTGDDIYEFLYNKDEWIKKAQISKDIDDGKTFETKLGKKNKDGSYTGETPLETKARIETEEHRSVMTSATEKINEALGEEGAIAKSLGAKGVLATLAGKILQFVSGGTYDPDKPNTIDNLNAEIVEEVTITEGEHVATMNAAINKLDAVLDENEEKKAKIAKEEEETKKAQGLGKDSIFSSDRIFNDENRDRYGDINEDSQKDKDSSMGKKSIDWSSLIKKIALGAGAVGTFTAIFQDYIPGWFKSIGGFVTETAAPAVQKYVPLMIKTVSEVATNVATEVIPTMFSSVGDMVVEGVKGIKNWGKFLLGMDTSTETTLENAQLEKDMFGTNFKVLADGTVVQGDSNQYYIDSVTGEKKSVYSTVNQDLLYAGRNMLVNPKNAIKYGKFIGKTVGTVGGFAGRRLGGKLGESAGKAVAKGIDAVKHPISTAKSVKNGVVNSVIASPQKKLGDMFTAIAGKLSKVADSSLMKKAGEKFPGSVGKFTEALRKTFTSAASKCTSMGDDFCKKATAELTQAGTEATAKTAGGASTAGLVTVVLATYDFISGACEAPRLFNVSDDEVDAIMRLISALFKTLLGLAIGPIIDIALEIISEIVGYDIKCEIATTVYQVLAKLFGFEESLNQLRSDQEQLAIECQLYNDANGTNLSTKAYSELKNPAGFKAMWKDIKNIFGVKGESELQTYEDQAKALMAQKKSEGTVTTNLSKANKVTTTTTTTYTSSGMNKFSTAGYGNVIGYGPAQNDPRWANYKLGNFANGKASTMATGGCGPTALAQIAGTDPLTVAKMAKSNGYIANGGSTESLMTSGAKKMGLNPTTVNNNYYGALANGDPVILAGKGNRSINPFTQAGHIVTATGLDRNGNVLVSDPMTGTTSSYSRQAIDAGLTGAWAYGKKTKGYGVGRKILGYGYQGFESYIEKKSGDTMVELADGITVRIDKDTQEASIALFGQKFKLGKNPQFINPEDIPEYYTKNMKNSTEEQNNPTYQIFTSVQGGTAAVLLNPDKHAEYVEKSKTMETPQASQDWKHASVLSKDSLIHMSNASNDILGFLNKTPAETLNMDKAPYADAGGKHTSNAQLSHGGGGRSIGGLGWDPILLNELTDTYSDHVLPGGKWFYSVNESEWADLPWNGSTVSKKGYDLVALAMALSSATGKAITPKYIIENMLPRMNGNSTSLKWKSLFNKQSNDPGFQFLPELISSVGIDDGIGDGNWMNYSDEQLVELSKKYGFMNASNFIKTIGYSKLNPLLTGDYIANPSDKSGIKKITTSIGDYLMEVRQFSGSPFGGTINPADITSNEWTNAILATNTGATDGNGTIQSSILNPLALDSETGSTISTFDWMNTSLGKSGTMPVTNTPVWRVTLSNGDLAMTTDEINEFNDAITKGKLVETKENTASGILGDILTKLLKIGSHKLTSIITGKKYERILNDDGSYKQYQDENGDWHYVYDNASISTSSAVNTADIGGSYTGSLKYDTLPASIQKLINNPSSMEDELVGKTLQYTLGAESSGSYSAVNADDRAPSAPKGSGALSMGLLQWHGPNARNILLHLATRLEAGGKLDEAAKAKEFANLATSALTTTQAKNLVSFLESDNVRDENIALQNETVIERGRENAITALKMIDAGELLNPRSGIVLTDMSNVGPGWISDWRKVWKNKNRAGITKDNEINAVVNSLNTETGFSNGWTNRVRNVGNFAKALPRGVYFGVGDDASGNATSSSAIATLNKKSGDITSMMEQLSSIANNKIASIIGGKAYMGSSSYSPLSHITNMLEGGGDDTNSSVKDWFNSKLGEGTYVSSDYGYRKDPHGSGATKKHNGIDFAAVGGAPIPTPVAGTVISNNFDEGGFGNYVVVEDSQGLYHYFAHMCQRSQLAVGQRVAKGDVIGYVGSTGSSTGNHLHYEIRTKNERGYSMDPNKYNISPASTGGYSPLRLGTPKKHFGYDEDLPEANYFGEGYKNDNTQLDDKLVAAMKTDDVIAKMNIMISALNDISANTKQKSQVFYGSGNTNNTVNKTTPVVVNQPNKPDYSKHSMRSVHDIVGR